MASLSVSDALGQPLSLGEQISLAASMILASKGAAGVTGAGLATLAGGLQAHQPGLVGGVRLIVGIDRFTSEARALTNFAGNAVAPVLVAPGPTRSTRNASSASWPATSLSASRWGPTTTTPRWPTTRPSTRR